MGHDGVASGYSTPTGFCRLMGCQRDPRGRGFIAWYQNLGKRLPRELSVGIHKYGPNTSSS